MIRTMPGTILGLVVGIVSVGTWGYLSAAPAVPPVPEEEVALALSRSPIVGVGPEFPIDPEIAALREAGRPALPTAEPAAETAPAGGPAPAPAETAVVVARAPAAAEQPPPPSRPPRRWVYAPPGGTRRPPVAASWEAAGPQPLRDEYGLAAEGDIGVAGVPLQEDRFGLADLNP